MKSRFIAILLIVTILLGSWGTYYTLAATKSELNTQSSELDTKIAEKEKEIETVESNLSAAMKEVQTLVAQISTYEQAISDLNDKINTVSDEITQAENDIAQKEKETEEKQDLLNKRLIAIYESGNTSYLDMLLTSSDLSDFLSKYYLISEIAEYDTNLIISLKEARAKLEEAKIELETNKASLENAKAEQVEKQEALKKIKAEKDSKVASLNSEEKALESELEEFEKDKKDVQSQLAAIARQEAAEAAARAAAASGGTTASGGTSSSSGYIFPIPGLSKSNIRTLKYPSYAGHTGVDININVVGKNVVAVKSGTVAISTAMRRADGSYKSYGEYVVINHHDGTMTLYAHMLSGSRTVSPGDEVTQGQIIGTVGSTGNSTGPHLHFEVRVNGSPVNPISYLP
ncbi:MAG: peptidoglycan DD-metalloendopeptidase family protein [Clostridia bacterium]|nr:peptidoglycan DD-metalloendopeptidase family protein [Clostridia bacterium]